MAPARKPCVAVVGALPPPMQGAAQITALMTDALAPHVRVRRFDTAPHGFTRGVAYHLRRCGRVTRAAAGILAGGFGRCSGAVYLSAAGGSGVFYDMVVAAASRLCARPLFIHHHSFAYIDTFVRRNDRLFRIAGPRCTHVCLCSRMADNLKRLYPAVRHTRVVSNAGLLPADGMTCRTTDGADGLRLGHLSNLCHDKGLDLVLRTFESVAEDCVASLVLGGAPVDAAAAALLDDAVARSGARIDARGPIAGDSKARFFADIDVFLFPTRYVNEAEPLVVIEALSAGVPVIAYGRGCIVHMIPENAGRVVAPGDDFVAAAVGVLERFARDPEVLAAASAAAQAAAAEAHASAGPAFKNLVAEIADRQPGGEPCLLCGGATDVVVSGLYDNRFGAPGTYAVLACRSCGFLQTAPRPDAATLEALYERYYNFGGREPGAYAKSREKIFETWFYRLWLRLDGDITFSLRTGRGRLLDIGCNEGRGLRTFRENGFSPAGIELNRVAAAQAAARGFHVSTEPLENFQPSRPFDVAVLSNVLEHALDPRDFLRHVHRVLAANGEVWISLPNADSAVCRWFGRHWINWHVPYHISHFSRAALTGLLAETGFEVTGLRTVTPSLWVAQSLIASIFSRRNARTAQIRNRFLLMGSMLIVRVFCFPVLWALNRAGKGDCMVVVARKKQKQ